MVDDFFRFLAFHLPLVTNGDRMRWKLTKTGDFTIRSYYHKLHGSSSIVLLPFVWTTTWDRSLPGGNLRLRGVDFIEWSIMCRCCEETVDHLL